MAPAVSFFAICAAAPASALAANRSARAHCIPPASWARTALCSHWPDSLSCAMCSLSRLVRFRYCALLLVAALLIPVPPAPLLPLLVLPAAVPARAHPLSPSAMATKTKDQPIRAGVGAPLRPFLLLSMPNSTAGATATAAAAANWLGERERKGDRDGPLAPTP
jgi:hypothetical protein